MYSIILLMAMDGPAQPPAVPNGPAPAAPLPGGAPMNAAVPGGASNQFAPYDYADHPDWKQSYFGAGIVNGSRRGWWPGPTMQQANIYPFPTQGFNWHIPVFYGYAGCYGSCYGSFTNYFSYWSMPFSSHYGYQMPMHAPEPPPVKKDKIEEDPKDTKDKDKSKDKDEKKKNGKPPAEKGADAAGAGYPALIVIALPANATLYANGVRTRQNAAERGFVTPPLERNQPYHYTFIAEMERDGQMVSETKQVEVRSGARIRVDFGTLAAAKPRDPAVATSQK
jgi:uncharacterized protein (TIGR03000 family)